MYTAYCNSYDNDNDYADGCESYNDNGDDDSNDNGNDNGYNNDEYGNDNSDHDDSNDNGNDDSSEVMITTVMMKDIVWLVNHVRFCPELQDWPQV